MRDDWSEEEEEWLYVAEDMIVYSVADLCVKMSMCTLMDSEDDLTILPGHLPDRAETQQLGDGSVSVPELCESETVYLNLATEDTVGRVDVGTNCQFVDDWCTTHNVVAISRKTRCKVMDRVVVGGDMQGTERLVFRMIETLTCSARLDSDSNLNRLAEGGQTNWGVTSSYFENTFNFGEVARDRQTASALL